MITPYFKILVVGAFYISEVNRLLHQLWLSSSLQHYVCAERTWFVYCANLFKPRHNDVYQITVLCSFFQVNYSKGMFSTKKKHLSN